MVGSTVRSRVRSAVVHRQIWCREVAESSASGSEGSKKSK